MQLPRTTIDHETLQNLVDTGKAVRAEVVGQAGAWGVVIKHGRSHQTLAARRGHTRLFRRFETLASYLREMGITAFHVDATEYETSVSPGDAPDRRSSVASQRMKRAHEAASYDAWFRESVQASLDDPRPSVSDEVARKEHEARRAELLRRMKGSSR
jgi:uncharacterized protein with von Willebrand factor type A (vWA) domain